MTIASGSGLPLRCIQKEETGKKSGIKTANMIGGQFTFE